MNNLLTNNSAATVLTAGSVVPLGSAIHGYGKSIRLNGNSISISTAGYYDIEVSVSAEVTGTDTVTIQLYDNGVAIPGALGSATPGAAGAEVNISFPWVFRKEGCGCRLDNLTLVVSDAVTVNNVIVFVEQEI